MMMKGEEKMVLQDKLDRLKADFEAKAPKDVLEIMHRATDDLNNSGIMQQVLKIGDKAPEFDLKNAAENLIRSMDLLSSGPVVLSFFRGRW